MLVTPEIIGNFACRCLWERNPKLVRTRGVKSLASFWWLSKAPRSLPSFVSAALVASALGTTACAFETSAPGPDPVDEPTSESTADDLSVYDDDLNGLWIATVDGKKQTAPSMTEFWPALGGVRLTQGGSKYTTTRTADTLSSTLPAISLAIQANEYTAWDDTIVGTIDGHSVSLKRDTRQKAPIVLDLPGDRPYRQFLTDMLMPAAQQDRESYTKITGSKIRTFLKSCELYKSGSLQWKFIKGDTWADRNYNTLAITYAVDGLVTTPRKLIKEQKFVDAVKANLKDESQTGLALTTFSMYFAAGMGRSVRIPITDDSMAYFITDRPTRGLTIGLVAMDTPTHGPLASTFGRQLLDLGAMPAADDDMYTRSMLELLVKSDRSRASLLSGVGQSALTDWFAVMAIEDYRGMAFGYPTLGWGYNMTNVQFYGLVARALARPGATDSAGNPVVGQVLVGNQLRPGEASYADVLNNGNDMQEYTDMSNLKRVVTSYLKEKHAQKVLDVENAFANVIPKNQLDARAQTDVFHFITAQLYDSQGRTSNLSGASATTAVESVAALLNTLRTNSADLEAYILSKGYVKSNEPAPKSTGF